MKTRKLIKFCAWSLGIACLCLPSACARDLPKLSHFQQSEVEATQNLSPTEIVAELVEADVVYLGETHNRLEDHQAQLEILVALYSENPKIAIALEMFQRPFQDAIDAYLAGKITEEELLEQTEYDRRWGFPWEFYAPLLQFAKTHQLPVVALNAPTEVTRKVAREGLESLTAEEQQHIPSPSEIDIGNAQYRQKLQEVYESHSQSGHGNSDGFENFFTVQVLWDETMADRIAQFYQANPDYQILVIAGQGHIVCGYGIPSRVERRLGDRAVQRSVVFGVFDNQQCEEESADSTAIADYFWQHQSN